MKNNVRKKVAREIKGQRGRPRTVAQLPDVLEIKMIPIPESSDQFEKRAHDVREMIAQIILLGVKSERK